MAIILSKRRTTNKPSSVVAPQAVQFSPAPKELLTIREAMAFAKASDATIRRWIRSKQLRAYKAGGQVRIDKTDLVKFLQPWSPAKACEHPK